MSVFWIIIFESFLDEVFVVLLNLNLWFLYLNFEYFLLFIIFFFKFIEEIVLFVFNGIFKKSFFKYLL